MQENFRRFHEWENENREKLEEIKKNSKEKKPLNDTPDFKSKRVYPKKSIYLISYAKIPHNNSLAFFQGSLGIGFVIDLQTDIILDCCGTFITDEAETFIKSLVTGTCFDTDEDINTLVDSVKFNFNCSAQKAACVILRNNFTIYSEWKTENKSYLNTILKNNSDATSVIRP